MPFTILLVLILFSYNPICHGLQISKNTKVDIRIKEGYPYDLNCEVDEKWDFCSWTNLNTNGKCLVVDGIDDKECTDLNHGDEPRVFSFRINEKTCTLRISEATLDDHAQWKCLIHSGISHVEASLNVTVYSPTQLDFKTRPNRRVTKGKTKPCII